MNGPINCVEIRQNKANIIGLVDLDNVGSSYVVATFEGIDTICAYLLLCQYFFLYDVPIIFVIHAYISMYAFVAVRIKSK